MSTVESILKQLYLASTDERDKGDKFERLMVQFFKTDAPSKIVNDPNDWALEVGDPRYILDLLARIVTVSVETVRIVKALPGIDFAELTSLSWLGRPRESRTRLPRCGRGRCGLFALEWVTGSLGWVFVPCLGRQWRAGRRHGGALGG